MNTFIFTVYAKKQFLSLAQVDQNRMLAKLAVLKKHPDIFAVLRSLIDFYPATHRLRIGSYRLILKLEPAQTGENTFLVLKVGHRKDVYQ
ncbi:MAG: type II toxin-antitoxin system RelE/ParE family toxin [Candidatus Gracilibacteria bacterium]